jgi:hypothetical protein
MMVIEPCWVFVNVQMITSPASKPIVAIDPAVLVSSPPLMHDTEVE